MATITIINNIPSLCGVFNIHTVDFKITSGVAPIFDIDGVVFSTVFVKTETGEDYYSIDLTDILRYFIDVPIMSTSGLNKTITLSINGSGATEVTSTHVLSIGYNDMGKADTLIDLVSYGRRDAITYFHSGNLSFYSDNAAGTYALTIGGVTENYILSQGENTIELASGQLINGKLTGTNISIEIVYIAPKSNQQEIQWIDRDGLWSYAFLRKLNTTYESKVKKQLPNYSTTSIVSFNRTTQIDKIQTIEFDCIAVSLDHYKSLVRISESLVISHNSTVYRVKQNSNSFAECKQNLHFTLTLETEDYAPNF